ncbi:MAG: hypothetical protein IPJ58_16535 [Ardenticatenia bacterium]|nr:hypothetical protein [Ardenticatenia bacterium]
MSAISWGTPDAKAFADVVGKAAKHGAARQSGLPIIQCLRLTQDGDRLTVEGTDLSHAVRVVLQGHGGHGGDGQVCVGAADLAALAGRMSDGGTLSLRREGVRLVVVCGSSRASLPVMDPADFPSVAWDSEAADAVTLDGRVLAALLSTAAAAAATDDNRPALHAVRLVAVGSGSLLAEGADGFRCMRMMADAQVAHGLGHGLLWGDGLLVQLGSARTALAFMGAGQVRLSRGSTGRLVLSDAAGAWDVALALVDGAFPQLGKIFDNASECDVGMTASPSNVRRALALATTAAAQAGITQVDLSVSSADGVRLGTNTEVTSRLGNADASMALHAIIDRGFSGEAGVTISGRLLSGLVDAMASAGADGLTLRIHSSNRGHPIMLAADLDVGGATLQATAVLMPMRVA